MPCFHPLRATRTPSGTIQIKASAADANAFNLPCGNCIGCKEAHAKAWAFRCKLELQDHLKACFTTLTYADKYKPPTLQKDHLQRWLKRLRKTTTRHLRFFACGEYGDNTKRPHYHAILFGVSPEERETIERTWRLGHARTYNISDGAIEYVAGYTVKKYTKTFADAHEQVDPTTGEVYRYQPPFIQMSRNPGIGGTARKYTESWKEYAVTNGHKHTVPRFLHEAWKKQATEEEIQQLKQEREKYIKQKENINLEALEQIAKTKLGNTTQKRKL